MQRQQDLLPCSTVYHNQSQEVRVSSYAHDPLSKSRHSPHSVCRNLGIEIDVHQDSSYIVSPLQEPDRRSRDPEHVLGCVRFCLHITLQDQAFLNARYFRS